MVELPSPAKIAVFIDAENLHAASIRELWQQLGVDNIAFKRAYGDWFEDRLKAWKSVLTELEIKPIHTLAVAPGKNAADMCLVIEAMDLLHLKRVNCFCIVSGDRDFVPLIRRLKNANVRVIGAGATEALKQICHDFIPLKPAKQSAPSEPVASQQPQLQVINGSASSPKATNPKQQTQKQQTQNQQAQKQQAQNQQTQKQQTNSKPYAAELRQIFLEAWKLISRQDWVEVGELQKHLSALCKAKLNQGFSCKLFGYKKMVDLINGVGLLEWHPSQANSTQLLHRKVRLKKAA